MTLLPTHSSLFTSKKYFRIFELSWESGFAYRLSFVMWRFRTILQCISAYFIWLAILQSQSNPFGYTSAQLFTYVLGSNVLRSVVFSGRSIEAQNEISSGDLNNYLVKPLSYFRYLLSRDIADKLLNILFSLVELVLLYVLLRPPLVTPPTPLFTALFIVAAVLAACLYFLFSSLVSMSTFWLPEGNGWPQRFFILVLLEFVSGGLFPLDILPVALSTLLTKLPTAYFLHLPMQIYLDRLSLFESAQALTIACLWIGILASLCTHTFRKGLKIYGAYGR